MQSHFRILIYLNMKSIRIYRQLISSNKQKLKISLNPLQIILRKKLIYASFFRDFLIQQKKYNGYIHKLILQTF